MAKKQLKPVHPGEVLLEEFLKPMKLSQNRLALDIGVPSRRINEIVAGKRSVTAGTALRLGRCFHILLPASHNEQFRLLSVFGDDSVEEFSRCLR